MKHILLCTIMRNTAGALQQWHSQLRDLVQRNPYIDFELSVFENDSIDGTNEQLRALDFGFMRNTPSIVSVTPGYPSFGSVKDKRRVKILAECRNKCVEAKLHTLCDDDEILFIEADVSYGCDVDAILYHKQDIDIYSAWSLDDNGKLYDGWATRLNPSQHVWNYSYRVEIGDYISAWSTFSCFCLYNAAPFLRGIMFGSHNTELNTWDCDTAVICYDFHRNGYHKVYMNTNIHIKQI